MDTYVGDTDAEDALTIVVNLRQGLSLLQLSSNTTHFVGHLMRSIEICVSSKACDQHLKSYKQTQGG